MNEKKRCPCPRRVITDVDTEKREITISNVPRDKMDIEWLVEQRVQRTLQARESYNSGFYEGLMYGIIIAAVVAVILYPDLFKKVVA